MTAASHKGIHPAIFRASGPASTRSPPVASTESTKPYWRASHGSITSRTSTAAPNTGTPCTGRPAANATNTRVAITAARTTLGSGVTRITNPRSTSSEHPTRAGRDNPTAAPANIMRPITMAQFAPDTAVRWLKLLAFIASSSESVTAVVSPMASPGSRSAPSPGRSVASAVKPTRRSDAHASHPGAPSTISPGCSANTR